MFELDDIVVVEYGELVRLEKCGWESRSTFGENMEFGMVKFIEKDEGDLKRYGLWLYDKETKEFLPNDGGTVKCFWPLSTSLHLSDLEGNYLELPKKPKYDI